jgi:hypothetical protein
VAEKEYTKLTPMRQTRGLAVITSTRSNLWLGKDHLLCIETEGYTESYRRFYFRDIQAITLRKTNRMLILAIITGIFVAMFATFTLMVDDIGGKWTLAVVTFVFAIPFALNFVYGSTCSCELRTAVQTEKIASMGRVRRARKVIARIRPFIGEAQGQLMPEEVSARFQEMIAAQSGTTSSAWGELPPRVNG